MDLYSAAIGNPIVNIAYTAETWEYWHGYYDGSNIGLSKNLGTPDTDSFSGAMYNGSEVADYIGTTEPHNQNSIVDEFRISTSKRTDAWIKATYNTTLDSLITWGDETSPGTTSSSSITSSVTSSTSSISTSETTSSSSISTSTSSSSESTSSSSISESTSTSSESTSSSSLSESTSTSSESTSSSSESTSSSSISTSSSSSTISESTSSSSESTSSSSISESTSSSSISESTSSSSSSESTSSSTSSESSSSSSESTSSSSESTSESTSSSSQTVSTSSTIIENKIYSRGSYAELPSGTTDLTTLFSEQDYTDVSLDDGDRVNIISGNYGIVQFKDKGTNNTSEIHVRWNGQTDLAPSQSGVVLQIYNYNTSTWENMDTDDTTGANIDFDLVSDITENLSNYYGDQNWVCHRVYQLK